MQCDAVSGWIKLIKFLSTSFSVIFPEKRIPERMLCNDFLRKTIKKILHLKFMINSVHPLMEFYLNRF